MRRTFTALVVLFVLPLFAVPVPAGAAVPIVVIDGRGWGHGVGMAQEGALHMGSGGATTEAILRQFYPGTADGRAKGPVRVPVLDAGRPGKAPAAAILSFPDGGEIRESGGGAAGPGFPVRVGRGGSVRIAYDGRRYRVEAAGGGVTLGRMALISATRAQVPPLPDQTTTTTAPGSPVVPAPPDAPGMPPPTSPPPPSGPAPDPPPDEQPAPSEEGPPPAPSSPRSLVASPADGGSIAVAARKARYRGTIDATAASGTLRFVNTVDVETYLKGMGEVLDPRWPAAALRAQAIAARTYALRAMAAGGEICDTQRCQVYLGAQAEYAAMNRAVDDTRDRVLTFNNSLISAVYSANGGGFSANQEEGFGVVDFPVSYLRPAPYPTKDPNPWSVTVALKDVAARLGYRGQLTDVRIARAGPSQRAIEVVLDGSAGPRSVPGLAFDAALGLRSTLFTVRIDMGEAPPPPPPDDPNLVQAPPDEAAAAVAGEVAGAPVKVETAAEQSARLQRDQREGKNRRRFQLLVVAFWLIVASAGAAAIMARDSRVTGQLVSSAAGRRRSLEKSL